MNPLSFFNSTSLLFLGVLVLCCALLFAYFESKAREQNHKISSMLSLVSSLTEEVQSIKRYVQSGGGGGMVKQMYQHQEEYQTGDDDVEDEVEDDDEDDDDLVSVSDDDDDDDEDEEDDDEENDENQVIEIGENVKILTLLQPIEIVSDGEDENTEYDADDLLDDDELKSVSSKDDEKEQIEEVKIFDLKSIHLEEPAVVDYKKLSIGKLRSIVEEKAIVEDSSRMKKQDLLKLLGVE
jgi:hypothetical protein